MRRCPVSESAPDEDEVKEPLYGAGITSEDLDPAPVAERLDEETVSEAAKSRKAH
jgi:hypothetical protein